MLTGDMLRRATARFPDKTAIIWEGRHTTYTDLNAQANRFAHALAGLGLKKGEKVGIISRNRTEYGIVFFGAAKSGCVLVNVSVLYAPDELQYVLDKADVQVLIYEDLFAEKVEAVKPNCPKIETYIPIGQPFDDFIAGHAADEPDVELDERDPVFDDLYRRYHRPAQGRAGQPPRAGRHRAYRHGRGEDRRA